MKRPAFQFYPGDWLRDPGVRAISFAARGLWTDMLCLMHESDRRGYLQLNGKPVNAEQLARMTGGSTDDVSRLLQELEDSGVFSRSEHGMIYSRRMTRDERKREKCAEAGKRGGNPTLKGHPKGRPKGESNRNPTPSSSTSVMEPSGSTPLPPGGGNRRRQPSFGVSDVTFPPGMDSPAVRTAVADWLDHKRARGGGYKSAESVNRLLGQWLMAGPIAFVQAVNNSIANNYQGVHAGGPRAETTGAARRETAAEIRERGNVEAIASFMRRAELRESDARVDGPEANGGLHRAAIDSVARRIERLQADDHQPGGADDLRQ